MRRKSEVNKKGTQAWLVVAPCVIRSIFPGLLFRCVSELCHPHDQIPASLDWLSYFTRNHAVRICWISSKNQSRWFYFYFWSEFQIYQLSCDLMSGRLTSYILVLIYFIIRVGNISLEMKLYKLVVEQYQEEFSSRLLNDN